MIDALDQIVQWFECSLVRKDSNLLDILSLMPYKGARCLCNPDPDRVDVERGDEERPVHDGGALPDGHGEAKERNFGGALCDPRAPLLDGHLGNADGIEGLVKVVLGKRDTEDLRLKSDMLQGIQDALGLASHGADDQDLLPSGCELIVVLMLVNGVTRADSRVEALGSLPASKAGGPFTISHSETTPVVAPVVTFQEDCVLSG